MLPALHSSILICDWQGVLHLQSSHRNREQQQDRRKKEYKGEGKDIERNENSESRKSPWEHLMSETEKLFRLLVV